MTAAAGRFPRRGGVPVGEPEGLGHGGVLVVVDGGRPADDGRPRLQARKRPAAGDGPGSGTLSQVGADAAYAADLGLAYRSSQIPEGAVIISATASCGPVSASSTAYCAGAFTQDQALTASFRALS